MTDRDDPVTGRRFASALKTLLTIAFVVAGIVYVAANFEEFRGLSWPSVHAIAAVAIGFVASVGFRSLFNYYSARRLGADLALSESFMLSAIVTASNSLLPANAGAAFRAWYMKRVHALPLGYFASTTMLSFLVTTLLMSLVAMLLLVLIHRELGYFRLDLFIALPLIAAVMMIGLLLRAKPSGEREPETSVWHSFRSGYFQLVGDTRLGALSLLIVSLNFVVAAIVWVVFCIGNGSELVAADYYEQEVEYQKQIERAQRTERLDGLARIRYLPEQARIELQLPQDHAELKPKGIIELYRPAEAALDQVFQLELDTAGVQHINVTTLKPGLWDVRVRWLHQGAEYFLSEEVTIGSDPSQG
jgi:hypothetical protein